MLSLYLISGLLELFQLKSEPASEAQLHVIHCLDTVEHTDRTLNRAIVSRGYRHFSTSFYHEVPSWRVVASTLGTV